MSHHPGSCGALSLATYGPAEVGRDYGFMLIAIAMPTAVLGWGVRRTARERAKAEV